jgi:hypothetical protein
MRKLATILIVVCTSSFLAVAQSTPADGTTPSKEEVLKFLDILRVKSQLSLYFDGVAKQARLEAEEGFKHKVPDATPAQLADVDNFAEKLFQGMPIDEMVDAMGRSIRGTSVTEISRQYSPSIHPQWERNSCVSSQP